MERVYFNNAAGAYPLSPGVSEAVGQALSEPPLLHGRGSSFYPDGLKSCRARLARLLGAGESRVVLTSGATYGLNAAILGLGLKRGDLVVTTVMEHNSVLRPLALLEKRLGIRVEYVTLNGGAKLDRDAYGRLLAEKPRLVVMTHSSNVTGRVNPVRELFADAKNAGAATLLDACQTVGRMPVIPDELYADMVAFSGHKWLRGPMGTGALYVSPRIELEPIFTGGTGVKGDLRFQPDEMPMRLEAGTPNYPGFCGLNAALAYYESHTGEIAVKETAMTERLVAELRAVPKVRVYDEDVSERLPVISFSVDGTDAETIGFALSESFGVECRAGLHCAPLMHKALGISGSVRLSPSYMNDSREMDFVIEAVRTVAGSEF